MNYTSVLEPTHSFVNQKSKSACPQQSYISINCVYNTVLLTVVLYLRNIFSKSILCRRGHTIFLASDTMRHTDPSRKLCRRRGETWLVYFPARMGRDLTMVCCQFSLSLCTCMITRFTDWPLYQTFVLQETLHNFTLVLTLVSLT
jgi:hypothetical protein